MPDWGGLYTLPRIVGLQKAKELIFTGRRFDAEEAKAMGIVHAIYPDDELVGQAQAFAGRFRQASTDAIAIAKSILNQAFELDHRTLLELEASAQSVARTSDYHKEAIRRFAAKEPALFDWEAIEARAAE